MNSIFPILIILLTFPIISLKSPIFQFPFSSLSSSTPSPLITIKAFLNSSPFPLTFLIDTSSFYITVFSEYTSNYTSPDTPIIEIPHHNYTLNATQSFINISFENNITITNISILCLQPETPLPHPKEIHGIFGLGFNYEDYDKSILIFSFVEKLYSNNIIDYRGFNITYTNESYNSGNITFGNGVLCKNERTSSCGSCRTHRVNSADYKYPFWFCALDYLRIDYFQNNTFKNKTISYPIYQLVSFDTSEENIIIPEDVFNRTIIKYLWRRINGEKACNITTYPNIAIECTKGEKDFINSISFSLKPFILVIKNSEIFTTSKDDPTKEKFIIQTSKGENSFVFGQAILKKYNIMYDKSNERIRFANQGDDMENLTSSLYYIFFFVIFIFIIALIFIVIFWYFITTFVVNVCFKRIKKKKDLNNLSLRASLQKNLISFTPQRDNILEDNFQNILNIN